MKIHQETGELSPGILLAGILIASSFPLVIVGLLPELQFVIDSTSYLLFHNIAEFFSVLVSLSMFGLGWYTYEQSRDRHALFLSTAFLGIGLMDFMHTLANAAMPPFITPNSSNKSTQFWIAVRLFQTLAFLASAFVYPGRTHRWLSKKTAMAVTLLVSSLVFSGVIFYSDYLPATYVTGSGLTPFKRFSEYLVIGLLCAATLAYWHRMRRTGERQLVYYAAAFVICISGELSLAVYTRVFDTFNVLGHVYKVIAFYLIYHGIYRASVRAPYLRLSAMSEELKGEIAQRRQTAEALRQANENLELRVRERTAELDQRNAQLRTEIEDRAKAEEELRKSRDELELRVRERTAELRVSNEALTGHAFNLERLNEELQEFVFVASHDLQEPLRKIQTFGGMILERYRDPLEEQGRDYLTRMTKAASRMADLLRALLEYSRVASQPNPVEHIDIAQIIEDAVSDLELTILQTGGIVEVGEVPSIEADARQLRQLFQNLIANSMKYCEDGKKPHIKITGGITGNMCQLMVRDNGIGFDNQYVDRIFRPFQRLHGSSSRYDGTGMGLAICRKIVERHQGSIIAESVPGQGTTFIVNLPVRQNPRRAAV